MAKHWSKWEFGLDFTLHKYKELCQAMLDYEILTFKDYLVRERLPDRYMILRHDVDRKPENALIMAKIENEFGIHASYYFRMGRRTFKPEIIKKIAEKGHEIGYHYEALDKAKGDYEKAIRIFEEELEVFRKEYDVKTICMHGNPLTKWDNRDLWKKYDFKHYGVLGEAYLSLHDNIPYFTDTGRTWGYKYKIKDRFQNEMSSNLKVNTTDELIQLIRSGNGGNIYLLVHPNRWGKKPLEWLSNRVFDLAANIVMKLLYSLRSHKTA